MILKSPFVAFLYERTWEFLMPISLFSRFQTGTSRSTLHIRDKNSSDVIAAEVAAAKPGSET